MVSLNTYCFRNETNPTDLIVLLIWQQAFVSVRKFVHLRSTLVKVLLC